MENLFITSIHIDKVRHLENIDIPLSSDKMKHLILTGKNGSGKTSVLEAIKSYMNMFANPSAIDNIEIVKGIDILKNSIEKLSNQNDELLKSQLLYNRKQLDMSSKFYCNFYKGLTTEFNSPAHDIVESFLNGQFLVAFYSADRIYKAEIAKHIEKIELKNSYTIEETPGKKLVQYLLDLKTTAALAEKAGKYKKAEEIDIWFTNFEEMLKTIYKDDKLKLGFDIDSFAFTIHQTGHEPFDFNQLSSGYAAVLDIVVDIMMRMENSRKNYSYALPGIVLIDEIETHLHIELQKSILPFLTETFPNVQFIVSTHSPFILSSISNAVIYDLEKKREVEDLSSYSYEGIVEYYFNSDMYSNEVKDQFNLYKNLINKQDRTKDENKKLLEVITALKQVPSAAAPELIYAFKDMEDKRRDILNGKNQ